MKLLLLILTLCAITTHSFAQKPALKSKNGFYLNPNFNHTGYRYQLLKQQAGTQNKYLFTPNLTIGYLRGNKNRHNISLTSLDGNIIHSYKTMSAELRYSYDILALRKNKFSFYISPYLRGSSSYGRSTAKYTGNLYDHMQCNNTLSAGLAPVFEYRLGRRIDFVASLPLEFASYRFGKNAYYSNNEHNVKTYQVTHFLSQGEARIGIRLNLFRK